MKATSRRIDDGAWHEVSVSRNGKNGRVTVDGASTDFVTPGDSYQLDLDGSLMVGGVGLAIDSAAIPPSLWSATLRQGYVGCMRDLMVNGNAVDLAAFARQQDSGKHLKCKVHCGLLNSIGSRGRYGSRSKFSIKSLRAYVRVLYNVQAQSGQPATFCRLSANRSRA